MFWACGKAEFNSKSTWYNKAAYVLVSKKEEVRERSQARKWGREKEEEEMEKERRRGKKLCSPNSSDLTPFLLHGPTP